MKKLALLVILVLASFVALGSAFASDYNTSTSVWGISSDNGQWGYTFIQNWLNTNGYSSINAKTGYTLGDSDKTFWNSGLTTLTIQMEVAGYANQNKVGYYTLSTDGFGREYKTLTQLFAGSAGAGNSVTVAINKEFGLYMKSPDGCGTNTWYTYRFYNAKDQCWVDNAPQVLIYTLEAGKKWLVCWEDINWACSDRDYNDMIMTVTAAAAPEPVSAGLFLIGGAALAVCRRKQRG